MSFLRCEFIFYLFWYTSLVNRMNILIFIYVLIYRIEMPVLALLYSQYCFLVYKLTKDLFSDLKYQITLYKTHVGVEHLIFKNNNIKYSFIEC